MKLKILSIVVVLAAVLAASPLLMHVNAQTSKFYVAAVLPYVSASTQKSIYSVLGNEDIALGQKASMSFIDSVKWPTDTLKGSQYFSLSDIKTNAPKIKADGGTYVGYDFENSNTPSSELANPVQSFKTANQIATANGLQLFCSPGKSYAKNIVSQVAQYCAIWNGQGQGGEVNTSSYILYIQSQASKARAANPNIKVIAELSANVNGVTLSILEYDFSHVAQYVDGNKLWFGGSTTNTLQQYLTWFNSHY